MAMRGAWQPSFAELRQWLIENPRCTLMHAAAHFRLPSSALRQVLDTGSQNKVTDPSILSGSHSQVAYPMSPPITQPATEKHMSIVMLEAIQRIETKLDLIVNRLERDGGPLK